MDLVKLLLRLAFVTVGLLALGMLLVAPLLLIAKAAPSREPMRLIASWMAGVSLPASALLINSLMAFSHSARMGGESPALGLATVVGWLTVWFAPVPWWAIPLLAAAYPVVELGGVYAAWWLGEWLAVDEAPQDDIDPTRPG